MDTVPTWVLNERESSQAARTLGRKNTETRIRKATPDFFFVSVCCILRRPIHLLPIFVFSEGWTSDRHRRSRNMIFKQNKTRKFALLA